MAGAAHSTDGRPRLEGARYKYPTGCSLHTYDCFTLNVTHTLTHTYQFPSFSWASALDQYEVSVLRSKVGWTSARNNKRTNAPASVKSHIPVTPEGESPNNNNS